MKKFEHRAIDRLTYAQHAAFTGMDDWPIASQEFVRSFIAFSHHSPSLPELLP